LNKISQIHHLSALLRNELALLRSKHPLTLEVVNSSLVVNAILLIASARTKLLVTFTIPQAFFTGQGIQAQVERKYGEIDLAEVRRTVEGRVRSGGVGCMRGACEEIWEVWE
jgi:hypothetical protein